MARSVASSVIVAVIAPVVTASKTLAWATVGAVPVTVSVPVCEVMPVKAAVRSDTEPE